MGRRGEYASFEQADAALEQTLEPASIEKRSARGRAHTRYRRRFFPAAAAAHADVESRKQQR